MNFLSPLLIMQLIILTGVRVTSQVASSELEILTIKKQIDSLTIFSNNEIQQLENSISFRRKEVKRFLKSIDSLEVLKTGYNVDSRNIEIYNSLLNRKIKIPENYYDKKITRYINKLNKDNGYKIESNFFFERDVLIYFEIDKYKRAVKLHIAQYNQEVLDKKIKKFELKEIQLQNSSNLLFSWTGVNDDYFSILVQKNKMQQLLSTENEQNFKDSIKIEILKNTVREKLEELNVQIKLFEEQIAIEKESNNMNQSIIQNTIKYKCKIINDVEIYSEPIIETKFRNGDEIKIARAPGEWNDFIKQKVPAYKFKDFDSSNINDGLIYNFYAFIDSREIAPLGFHKMNILDFGKIENEQLFQNKKIKIKCCDDGMENIYKTCPSCINWTKKQRENTGCVTCGGNRQIQIGKKTCSVCNGKKYRFIDECLSRDKKYHILFCRDIFDKNYHQRLKIPIPFSLFEIDYNCKLKLDNNIYYYKGIEQCLNVEYQFLICKDKYYQKLPAEGTIIGDLEIMSTYLNVNTFRNGDPIEYIEDKVEWEIALKEGKPAYCNFNNNRSDLGLIYNIHAWKDKRGLIPNGWRSLEWSDFVYLRSKLGQDFNLNLQISPLNPPPGFRDKYGYFNQITTDNNNNIQYPNLNFEFGYNENDERNLRVLYQNPGGDNQSGYILCVRDAHNLKSEIKKNITLNNFDYSKSELIPNIENKGINANYLKDFFKIYNQEGQLILKKIYASQWQELFKNNRSYQFLFTDCSLECGRVENQYYQDYHFYGDYNSELIGIRLTQNKQNEILASIIKVDLKSMDTTLINDTLIPNDEITFVLKNDFDSRIKFKFDVNSCRPSNNPIDNFYISFGTNDGIRQDWQQISIGKTGTLMTHYILSAKDLINDYFQESGNQTINKRFDLIDSVNIQKMDTLLAEFPGGETELQKFLNSNVKFPEICMDMDAQGIVIMKFNIEEDGSISNIQVKSNRTGCDEFVQESTRVLKMMPNWIPGKINGEAIRFECTLPFTFKIH